MTAERTGACAGLLTIFMFAACSAPKYEQIALRVSDAQTGAPIEGADAVLRPLKFYLPIGDSPSPTPGDFQANRGKSDASGRILLRAPGNAPSELSITHPGYAAWHGVVEPWEAVDGTPEWRVEPGLADGNGPAVRVEVASD